MINNQAIHYLPVNWQTPKQNILQAISVMDGKYYQLRYFHQNSTVIQIWFVMQTHLLNTFNHYAFNHTTHIFISLLNQTQIQQLLIALQQQAKYSQLAHLLRANLFATNLHQIDRTLYFLHLEQIPENQLISQRCNLIAVNCQPDCLKKFLIQKESLEVVGKNMFGDQYDSIRQAIISPDLAMPPLIRQTMAPHCSSVYQIILACQIFQKIDYQGQVDHIAHNQTESQYFYQLLDLHVRAMHIYLSSINNPLEHFAEITYRLMVYTNTVLALHNISPFRKLSNTMQLWKNALSSHYQMANKVFLEVGGLSPQTICNQVGRISTEILINQGYLRDYCEGLVDLSMREDLPCCEHSRQSFGELYSSLEDTIVANLKYQSLQLYDSTLQQKIEEWYSLGLKPVTVHKIIQICHLKSSYKESDTTVRKAELNYLTCDCQASFKQIVQ